MTYAADSEELNRAGALLNSIVEQDIPQHKEALKREYEQVLKAMSVGTENGQPSPFYSGTKDEIQQSLLEQLRTNYETILTALDKVGENVGNNARNLGKLGNNWEQMENSNTQQINNLTNK